MRVLSKTFFAVLLVGVTCSFLKAQTVSLLELNKPIEREISVGQTHIYEIKVEKDKFISIIVDQKGADVAIKFGSLEFDNPNIKRGVEQIFYVSPTTGNLRLEIKGKETGRYEVQLESYRNPTPDDVKRMEVERAFLEAEKLSAASNFAQALAKYEEAYQLINGLKDTFQEATILFSLGKTHKALGNAEKSAQYFANALTLFQSAGSWDDLFRNLAPLYVLMGGKEQTYTYLAGAIPLVEALKNERLEAILLSALAKVCRDLNQAEKASDFTQKALELFRITGKRGAEVFNLTEIADGDLSLEDKKRAIDYLNQAILLSQGASDKSLEVSLLFGIAYIYNSIDEPQKALNYLNKTLPLWREVKDKNGEAYSLNFIGGTYASLGDFSLARDYLEQSLTLIRQTNDLRGEAHTMSTLGTIEQRLGNNEKAIDYHQKALQIFQQTGEKIGEANALSNLAGIFWFKGDKTKAVENYEKSLAIYQNLKFRQGEAETLSSLGFIYEISGNNDKALTNHNLALQNYRLLGSQSGEIWSLYGIARVDYIRGNFDESLTKTEAAINLIENIRSRIASNELRTSYLSNYQSLYKFYIDLLMQVNKQKPNNGFDAKALQVSERARARGLLDILNEARADIRQGIEPGLLERERNLQKQLNAKDAERKRASTPPQIEKVEQEIRKLTADYQLLEVEIKQKSPRYSALTQPQPVGLKEIQAILDADTVLLEYSLGETNSYLWLVSQNSLKTFILPKQEIIENQARLFYEAVKTSDDEQKANKIVSELSKILLTPISSELGNKRLLIVPDGALSYIPFAALQIPNSPSPTPLIVNNEIVYIPSASALSALRNEANGRISPPKAVAVLADPVFDAADSRVSSTAAQTTNSNNSTLKTAQRDAGFDNSQPLPRLPKTRAEATTITELAANMEKKIAIDFDANRATVTSSDMSNYRIIHFATHGLLNSQHPEFSGIALSMVNEKGQPQDGFLRLHEVYNLKLPADLVVLSACQTALGKEIRGEGLVGLTRGFMYAGAQRVVASLWMVDDLATARLMKNFYQGMLGERKLTPAAALREAQIAMWKSKGFSAPFYWAAFTLQGEWK
ncbi:MAG: CHAT domain-containing protein [Pyrinomonadaceae bacterium]|nr:CHAT domain-containing protein [Pyrinomonadaceae bacterium]